MSFIQIELGGQLRGLKFNQGANEIFWRKLKVSTDGQTQQIYTMFYAGLMGNCIAKEIDPDFDFEKVQDWVDELYLTEGGKKWVEAVDKCYGETQLYKNTLSKIVDLVKSEEPTKKKAVSRSGLKSTS